MTYEDCLNRYISAILDRVSFLPLNSPASISNRFYNIPLRP
jgi:hypothetical protein